MYRERGKSWISQIIDHRVTRAELRVRLKLKDRIIASQKKRIAELEAQNYKLYVALYDAPVSAEEGKPG